MSCASARKKGSCGVLAYARDFGTCISLVMRVDTQNGLRRHEGKMRHVTHIICEFRNGLRRHTCVNTQ